VNGKPEVSLTGAAKGGMVKLVVRRGWELIPSPPRPRIVIWVAVAPVKASALKT
jgi:hypothetical protein